MSDSSGGIFSAPAERQLLIAQRGFVVLRNTYAELAIRVVVQEDAGETAYLLAPLEYMALHTCSAVLLTASPYLP